MSDQPKHPLQEMMEENQRLVRIWYERMAAEAHEFAEMVQKHQTTPTWELRKTRDDDWNVDNR